MFEERSFQAPSENRKQRAETHQGKNTDFQRAKNTKNHTEFVQKTASTPEAEKKRFRTPVGANFAPIWGPSGGQVGPKTRPERAAERQKPEKAHQKKEQNRANSGPPKKQLRRRSTPGSELRF